METFRLEVGSRHGVKPGNIVGAIANEAGIESQHIGRIDIYDEYALVDLPEGMPKEIYRKLKKTWVAGRELRLSKFEGQAAAPRRFAAKGDGEGGKAPPVRKPRPTRPHP